MLDISFTPNPNPKPRPDPDTLVFGKTFTDHMFLMNYDAGQGWHHPRSNPTAPCPSSCPAWCSTTPRRSSRA